MRLKRTEVERLLLPPPFSCHEGAGLIGIFPLFQVKRAKKREFIRSERKVYVKSTEGNYQGGGLLYGYKVADKKILIDEEKAETVRFIFEQYSIGVFVRNIIKELTAKSYPLQGKTASKFTSIAPLKNGSDDGQGFSFYKGAIGTPRTSAMTLEMYVGTQKQ